MAAAEGSSSDEEVFDDGYDEQLMGDEEDRKMLESMTQVEREKIIFERLERRDALKTRCDLLKECSNKPTLLKSLSPTIKYMY